MKMSRVLTWFGKNSNSSSMAIITRSNLLKSFLINKQIDAFTRYLKQKDTQQLCIDSFFYFLCELDDEIFILDIFNRIFRLIGRKQMSLLIINKLQTAIRDKNFPKCFQLLHLPFPQMKIPLETSKILEFIHHNWPTDQLFDCLTILITNNLHFDSEYLPWLLITLFEHYQTGDELIIKYILELKPSTDPLTQIYGNNSLTPLMLFFHLYTNEKCQQILDIYLSNIKDLNIFNQVDKWNRSYLTHLLYGRCQHAIQTDHQCPHEDVILSRFVMLYKLGNRCENLVRTIFVSEYCFSLRMKLADYLFEHRLVDENRIDEIFLNFPPTYFQFYEQQLKQLIQNRNLDSTLSTLVKQQVNFHRNLDQLVKFLLQNGARIRNPTEIEQTTLDLLLNFNQSLIPFLLLDYGFPVSISFQIWSNRSNDRLNLYVIRQIQCGYAREFREKYERFRTRLSQSTVEAMDKFIDIRNPSRLKQLCFQHLRKSLVDLSEKTIEDLNGFLRFKLRHSIRVYGYDECHSFVQTVLS